MSSPQNISRRLGDHAMLARSLSPHPMTSLAAAVALGSVALLTASAAAALGPKFTAPSPPAAKSLAPTGDSLSPLADLKASDRAAGPWWAAFGSERLNGVMALALKNNPTVAAADARLAKAQAEIGKAAAAQKPQVQGTASFERERINLSAFGFSGFPNPTIGLYSIGPAVSYDLDLFGRERKRVEGARAHALAQARRADAAYLTLTGHVAYQALTIAAIRSQIAAVNSVLTLDRRSVAILENAVQAGGATPAMVLQARLLLDQDQAQTPELQQKLEQARHALALLVGEAPAAWSAPDFDLSDFNAPEATPVGLPSELVRRRPDIQAVEADLRADTAMIGMQTARLYPDLRITASITQQALGADKLFGWGSSGYMFGPSLTAPLFDGGAIRADRRAAEAQLQVDLAAYRQTVLTAFGQVADVLSALGQDEARLSDAAQAEGDSRDALDRAAAALDAGGGRLSDTVIAERRWRQAQLGGLEARARRIADLIALFGATAADWRSPAARPKG